MHRNKQNLALKMLDGMRNGEIIFNAIEFMVTRFVVSQSRKLFK